MAKESLRSVENLEVAAVLLEKKWQNSLELLITVKIS